ncbi:MAG: entericidin A/B family lipoprotein [Pseudomonadota bacterium]|jgi:predicted small secreted protein|nr:entericidin A/B family lipoprotein [Pseudomonadota bacterium]
MRNTLLSILFSAFWLLTSATALTACSTIEGAGEDIQKAGSAIEDAAKDAK